jgi:hypothetical protein
LRNEVHSVARSTEPLHSPPTPIPWINRRTTSSTAPQTPLVSYVGTTPTRTVPIAIRVSVATRVALRPIRSPRCPKMIAPSGRARNPTKNVENASSVPASGSNSGKKSLLNTSPATSP